MKYIISLLSLAAMITLAYFSSRPIILKAPDILPPSVCTAKAIPFQVVCSYGSDWCECTVQEKGK